MNRLVIPLLAMSLMIANARCNIRAQVSEWSKLPSIPNKEGLAGSFAGVSHGALIVAGGANFPGKKPWEGGAKVWHDSVFVLEKPNGSWKAAGKLPRPLGYGVSVTHGAGLVCVGGSDSARHYADAFRLEWKLGKLVTTTTLPPLPTPLANSCGALVGDHLFVAGGQQRPDAANALKTVWRIDLSAQAPTWTEIEPCPGDGRILAVAAEKGGAFWLIGGAALSAGKDGKAERRYLRDAYRYAPGKGWQRIADLPRPVVAAPSPAPTDANRLYILGGDDGAQLKESPDKHRGFRADILGFDFETNRWTKVGHSPAPRVTVPCVLWNQRWVLPSGEVRPGIRSPEVWSFTPGKKE